MARGDPDRSGSGRQDHRSQCVALRLMRRELTGSVRHTS
jgi:hypothetical protein